MHQWPIIASQLGRPIFEASTVPDSTVNSFSTTSLVVEVCLLSIGYKTKGWRAELNARKVRPAPVVSAGTYLGNYKNQNSREPYKLVAPLVNRARAKL